MTTPRTATTQLFDELGVVAFNLAAILGTDIHDVLTARIAARADYLVAELTAGQYPDETASDILTVLWPHGDPELGWWRTPLGLAIAPAWIAHLGADESWSRTEAAEVLGVTRGTVVQLTARGSIERADDGGCSRASVLRRLLRLHAQQQASDAD